MPWIPMSLRGQRVLVRCDARGELAAEGGRVEVRYRPKGSKAYQAAARNLEPIKGATVLPDSHCDEAEPAAPAAKKAPRKKSASSSGASASAGAPLKAPPTEATAGSVIAYTDGACTGNPGPAGSGVVILSGGESRLELSEYLGRATNNIAELTAILRAAEHLAGGHKESPAVIYTDSKYSIGVLTQGWKAKKNPELIAQTKVALANVPKAVVRYVPGHAGIPGNERADELARAAIVARASSGWVKERGGKL